MVEKVSLLLYISLKRDHMLSHVLVRFYYFRNKFIVPLSLLIQEVNLIIILQSYVPFTPPGKVKKKTLKSSGSYLSTCSEYKFILKVWVLCHKTNKILKPQFISFKQPITQTLIGNKTVLMSILTFQLAFGRDISK